MTALLSLTNSSSNTSDITQLPFRPQSEWPHFSRQHSSMSTESFQSSSCECCNGRDEGQSIFENLPSLTSWLLGNLDHGGARRAAQRTVTSWGSGLPHVPGGEILFSHLKDSGRRRMWGSPYYRLDHDWSQFNWPVPVPARSGTSSQHMGGSFSDVHLHFHDAHPLAAADEGRLWILIYPYKNKS